MQSRRPTVPARLQQGTLLLGLMIGILCGLAVAVVVAVFVTRAPLPFVNKVPRAGERSTEIRAGAELPDPNRSLAARAPASSPAQPGAAAGQTATPNVPGQVVPAPGGDAPAAGTTSERVHYMLQAGAFRSSDDADNMRAKLALIGFEARISATEAGAERLYRVRIGPYSQQDDVNLARFRLAENGIEATVVRQR
jgi:cell division protein FtsN